MSPRIRRPSPLLAALFRAPAWLYRIRLGWILGERFLALTHQGRNSGRTYRTVLEVISYDDTTKESVVVSAYGTDADWYRNIRAERALRVERGRIAYEPEQRLLESDERAEIARRFCKQHPWEAKLIPRVLLSIGAHVPDEEITDPAGILSSLPMVAFRPGN